MANNNDNLPGDIEILLPWLNIIRRTRQIVASTKPAGNVIAVSLTVITDEFGNPMPLWTAPKVAVLEPRANAEETLREIVNLLTNAK